MAKTNATTAHPSPANQPKKTASTASPPKTESGAAERWAIARETRTIAGYDRAWTKVIRSQLGKMRTR